MEFQEYPKALYRNGEYTAVPGFDEEQAMRAEGWADWHSDQAQMAVAAAGSVEQLGPADGSTSSEANNIAAPKNKGGRPRKAE